MTNKWNNVLYTGVTSDLLRRVEEHRLKIVSSFTQKYNLSKLVYYEEYSDIRDALNREKQIKGGSRQKKLDLIWKVNPKMEDLAEKLFV